MHLKALDQSIKDHTKKLFPTTMMDAFISKIEITCTFVWLLYSATYDTSMTVPITVHEISMHECTSNLKVYNSNLPRKLTPFNAKALHYSHLTFTFTFLHLPS